MSLGEEGGSDDDKAITYAAGKEGGTEIGGGKSVTLAIGEGGTDSTLTTMAVGEEGGSDSKLTTMALGEEGGSTGGKTKAGSTDNAADLQKQIDKFNEARKKGSMKIGNMTPSDYTKLLEEIKNKNAELSKEVKEIEDMSEEEKQDLIKQYQESLKDYEKSKLEEKLTTMPENEEGGS